MGWAARANHRAIVHGQKTPAPKRAVAPDPPAGMVKRFINALLAESFGIKGGATVRKKSRRERFLERVERRKTEASTP